MEELQEIQSELLVTPSDFLFRREFVVRKKWRFLDSALQIFFKAKSRIRWLRDWDSNTKFFFKAVLAHQARNAIRYFIDGNDIKVTNKAQMKDMVVSYFQHLLSSVSVDISLPTMSELNILMRYSCQALFLRSCVQSQSKMRSDQHCCPYQKASLQDQMGFLLNFFGKRNQWLELMYSQLLKSSL